MHDEVPRRNKIGYRWSSLRIFCSFFSTLFITSSSFVTGKLGFSRHLNACGLNLQLLCIGWIFRLCYIAKLYCFNHNIGLYLQYPSIPTIWEFWTRFRKSSNTPTKYRQHQCFHIHKFKNIILPSKPKSSLQVQAKNPPQSKNE